MAIARSKTCFVLLPGLAPDNLPVLRLKEALERRGYVALASNFYGGINVNDFSSLTIQQCTAAVSDVIRNAKIKHQKVVGIGISLGGALLIEHAKKHGDLDGILSIGTPFKLNSRHLIKLGQVLIPFIHPVWRHFQKYKSLRLFPIGAASMVIDYIEKEFNKNLELVTTPTLFLHSKKDRISSCDVVPEFMAKLSSASKNLIILGNGNHTIDSDPDLVIRHAEAFFKTCDLRPE